MADISDRSMPARLQRHLTQAVTEFLTQETGFEPIAALSTRGMDFHDYTQDWQYLDIPIGVEIHVKVVDDASEG